MPIFLGKSLNKKILSAFLLSGCLVAGVQAVTWADGMPGLTIFSGVERENLLPFYLDFGGRPGAWDRYRLRIPGKKMTQGASKFIIAYPDYYDGKFDTDSVEVRVKDKSIPIREVLWDKESRMLEIDMAEPITASNKVELVLSNVKNPANGGTYYFNCQVLAANDIPIRLYLGTWIIDINR
jgi:hypothetical protein